jgi:hypothetical protein
MEDNGDIAEQSSASIIPTSANAPKAKARGPILRYPSAPTLVSFYINKIATTIAGTRD